MSRIWKILIFSDFTDDGQAVSLCRKSLMTENMCSVSFFTALKASLSGGWIPVVLMMCIQMVMMSIVKEGGRRAVDTSWYTKKDKCFANWTFILQGAMILLGIFLPLKTGTAWFTVGLVIFILGALMMAWAFLSYGKTPLDETVTRGIYKISRNPMYVSFIIGMVGATIATASLWMLILLILYIIATHGIILGEKRYCTETYGESYLEYKKATPRYFLFF